ncbi:MAG TPA: efflux transporter outer membrane subunit [Limnobacter sp.]|nr:efflux transporter outer membrane subunit [Limnobacter sp.]
MFKRSFCGMVIFLMLGACATPSPRAPDLETRAPSQFQGHAVLEALGKGNASSAWSDVRWWTGFADPTLNALVERAIANNFQIAAAAGRVQEARALLRLSQSRDDLLVELELVASAQDSDRGRQGNSTAGISNTGREEQSLLGGIGFAIPLDVAGRLDREAEAAAANLLALQAQLRGQVIATSTALTQEYLRLRGNQKQLHMLRDSVRLQEETLKVVQARFEAGLSPELDVRRAETSVENLRAGIPVLEKALQDGRFRLATLTGRFAGDLEPELMTPAPLPKYALAIPTQLPLQVLQNRPDVQEAQARFAQAAAELGVAEANFYPSVELMATLQVGSTASNGNPAVGILIGAVSAMINQVVWDGGARQAQLEAAKARAQIALANYELTLRQAVESVENALTALSASANRQGSLERAVASSKRSFEQADALYQLGLVSFLDVVDAQRVFANAEQTLATEQTNYATQVAALFQTLGVQSTDQQAMTKGDPQVTLQN